MPFLYIKCMLCGLIVLILGYKIWKLNHVKFDLDVLDKQVQPIKKSIQPGTTAGIYAINGDAAFIIQLQYVLAPVLTTDKNTADTLIYIHTQQQDLSTTMVNYRVIKQTDYKNMVIALITKAK